MSAQAAITVLGSPEEVQRRWLASAHDEVLADASIGFVVAPGDRGTEIHVDLGRDAQGNVIEEIARKLAGSEPVAKAKDDLRRFKAKFETGEVPRSDAVPEGERLERKLKQRPAQPLDARELEQVGV